MKKNLVKCGQLLSSLCNVHIELCHFCRTPQKYNANKWNKGFIKWAYFLVFLFFFFLTTSPNYSLLFHSFVSFTFFFRFSAVFWNVHAHFHQIFFVLFFFLFFLISVLVNFLFFFLFFIHFLLFANSLMMISYFFSIPKTR